MKFSEINAIQYTSDLSTFQAVKMFFLRSGGSENCKKIQCGILLMLNISLIKELLHKPTEIL